MSKYVKNLLTDDLRQRWEGVESLLLVDLTGVDGNQNVRLRQELREKNIQLLQVKNSLARRATAGTPLEPAFADLTGSAAVVWGGEDLVTVAKEVVRLAKEKEFEPFGPRGGVMDGAALTEEAVVEVSKWPSRTEQLSILVGQILSPGAQLSSQLIGPGGAVASQIEQKAEGGQEAEG